MTLIEQVAAMSRLQDTFNCRLNPNWRTAGYAWNRAIWVECAEMMDRTNWKWWKAAPASDAVQQKLELCDIWHFLLSSALVNNVPEQRLVAVLALTASPVSVERSEVECIERLAAAAISGDFDAMTSAFSVACRKFGLKAEELYRLYVGKNALNLHRNRLF